MPRIVQAIVDEAQVLPGQLTAIWQQFYAATTLWFTQTAIQIGTLVGAAVTTTVSWFSRLPGEVTLWLTTMLTNIWTTLSGLPGVFLSWLTATSGVVNAQLTATRVATTNEVSSWPGRISGWLASIPGIVGGIFNSMKNAALGEVNNLWDGLVAIWTKIKAIVGQITDAFNKGLGAGQSVGKALHLPGFATGTFSAPGGLALVGERGPELVALPRGSQVYPHGQSQRMATGPTTINQYNTINYPADQDLALEKLSLTLGRMI